VLREPIGQGGMGSVFLADQPGLGRSVAIEVLHPELARYPAHARRIRDEAMAASRVRSSHCLTVISVAMRLARGSGPTAVPATTEDRAAITSTLARYEQRGREPRLGDQRA
jgi:serine/threonine protein kinase